MKPHFVLLLLCLFYLTSFAQNTNNVYEDAKALKALMNQGKLDDTKSKDWLKILQKYTGVTDASDYTEIVSKFDNNPFGLNTTDIIPAGAAGFAPDSHEIQAIIADQIRQKARYYDHAGPAATTNTPDPTATPISTASVTYALTDLIIARGKEELSATFFEKLKTQIPKNPELQIAFPKTTRFIGQIESYLYASYLSTLRQAFADDINNIPFNIGAILRTSRMKSYFDKNPKSQDVWFVVPIMASVGELRNGKSLATAIKDLYPDAQLNSVNRNYYNLLKLVVCLSESIRDISGKSDWIDHRMLDIFFADPLSQRLFLGLLYEETKYLVPNNPNFVNNYVRSTKEKDITAIIKSFATGYTDTKDALNAIKEATASGTSLSTAQVLDIISKPAKDLQKTLADLDKLVPADQPHVNTDAIFETLPQLIQVINDFKDSHYASGLMNTLLIINNYIAPNANKTQPFIKDADLNIVLTKENLAASLQLTITKLSQYNTQYPDDHISGLVKKLNKLAKDTVSAGIDARLKDAQKLMKEVVNHSYNFDGMGIYQQLLKYGTLMASLSEADNTAAVTTALDAAILPVGSSSIKYYSASSFSLNSYIGAAYYTALYRVSGQTNKVSLNTFGVALPIGPNFSISTRSPIVGALSVFVSVVDLGSVASYRLNSPANTDSQNLPDFTFQNLLAPGGFLVLNRILKTPLALGFGAQRAPQLSSINNGIANLTASPTWRFGAFLTLDIPLFNLYSHALKRPLN